MVVTVFMICNCSIRISKIKQFYLHVELDFLNCILYLSVTTHMEMGNNSALHVVDFPALLQAHTCSTIQPMCWLSISCRQRKDYLSYVAFM